MTDIVERLRDADTTRRIGESYADTHERRQRDRNEAADEIERLKAELLERDAVWLPEKDAEIERLRAALREIESITVHSGGDIHGVHPSFWEVAFKQAQDTARDALKEDGE